MTTSLIIDRETRGQFELRAEQWVTAPLDDVFQFFSRPENLQVLTPAFLRFGLLTPGPLRMHAGLLIDYRIRLRGIPMRWQSQITCWEPPHRFIDEQLKGPYRTWRHEHTFTAERGGTRIRDHVIYRVPGGALVNRMLVEPDVRKIFAFRHQRMQELFSGPWLPDQGINTAGTVGRTTRNVETATGA